MPRSPGNSWQVTFTTVYALLNAISAYFSPSDALGAEMLLLMLIADCLVPALLFRT